MNSSPTNTFAANAVSSESPLQQRLEEALAEYHEAADSDRPIDREAFLEKYADVRHELSGYLDSFDLIHAMASELSDTSGASSSSRAALPQRATLGDFRILREIGRGGMGVVYEAEQLSLGRRVALKVLPFAAMLDKQQLARFKNEARAAATLDHPNIVAVHSIGVERSVHYYAMQLIEGQSLAQVVEQLRSKSDAGCSMLDASSNQSSSIQHLASSIDTQPIAALSTLPDFDSREYFRAIAQLGIQAAEALDHAHQNGILHRDIKPANLLVDDTGKLWITDFGLARIEQDAGMTMTGDILGTLRYMSPEQALAKRVVVDHRSDIYSLGVTFYEMLTLQPVYAGNDRQELLRKIAFEEPRPLRQINAGIPVDLETIILKSIEKNPEQRYATAQDLADDLRRYLDHKSIKARPPTWRDRMAKWSRRHPVAVRTAALFLLATTLVSTVSAALITRAYQREAEQRQLTEANAQRVQAIAEFLEDTLGGPDRDGGNFTFVEVLSRAVTNLKDQFNDDPKTKSDLLTTIGGTYMGLGMYTEAVPLAEQARDLRLRAFGLTDPNTLLSMRHLASAYQEVGRIEESITLSEKTVALICEHVGVDHELALGSKYELANAYMAAKRYDKAIPLFEELSKTKSDTDLLGLAYALAGRTDEGIPMMEQALELTKTENGADDASTLRRMSYLALGYDRVGRIDDAVVLYESIHRGFSHKYGPDDPETLKMLMNLADAYRLAGRYQDALRLYEDTLSRSKLGSNHPRTLELTNNFAWLLATATEEEFRDGKRAVELATQVCEQTDYKNSPMVGTLAAACAESGDFVLALKWLNKAIDLAENDIERAVHTKHLRNYESGRPWRATGNY